VWVVDDETKYCSRLHVLLLSHLVTINYVGAAQHLEET